MNLFSPVNGRELTHVESFCAQICHGFDHRLRERRVELRLDADRQLRLQLPTHRLRPLLEDFIEDALQAMPSGGYLEVIAVRTPDGLEIEVADSSEWEQRVLWRSEQSVTPGGNGRVVESRESDLRVETLRCPQGGWARIVSIPDAVTAVPKTRRAA